MQVSPTIGTGKPGPPPAARNAQAIGEAPAGIACRPPILGSVLEMCRQPLSQAWRTFLENHAEGMAGIDFFTVPTATFRIL